MKDEALYQLFKLHEIDEQLITIKNRAEHLDLGKREKAAIKKVQADYAEDLAHYKELQTQLNTERIRADQAAEKIKKFNAQLYDGSVTASKEINNLTKEIQMLEEIGMDAELKIEQLEAENQSLSKRVSKINAKIEELESQSEAKREQAEIDHVELKKAFAETGAKRSEREAAVRADILKTYNNARKLTGSTGLALITLQHRCQACGIDTPEKTREFVRDGKIQQCESCRRILFYREEAIES
jgi:predicted  nucleic acid-binding Zn-ribbon protein